MHTESVIRLVAGTLVIIGVLLARFANPWWLLLPLLVGVNLFQSVITRFCLLEIILKKLGMKSCRDTSDTSASD